MSISEIVDFSKMGVFLLWVLVPIIILVKNYLSAKIFNAFELTYLIISVMVIGYYEGFVFPIIYLIVIFMYTFWWATQFQKFRQQNPGQYEEYMKYYSEYYGDDLNEDGIKDAFEHWQIAHDPRFFWIFGSKLEKEKRRFEREKSMFFFRTGAQYYDDTVSASYRRRDRSAESNRDYYSRSRNDYRNYGGYTKADAANNNSNTYNANSAGSRTMSEEEEKIAKQHAFAREHNLRYFAMCESKDEAKKLYRKYAAKYHPDNAVTGDKDKFIKIDEEYNRFCSIVN